MQKALAFLLLFSGASALLSQKPKILLASGAGVGIYCLVKTEARKADFPEVYLELEEEQGYDAGVEGDRLHPVLGSGKLVPINVTLLSSDIESGSAPPISSASEAGLEGSGSGVALPIAAAPEGTLKDQPLRQPFRFLRLLKHPFNGLAASPVFAASAVAREGPLADAARLILAGPEAAPERSTSQAPFVIPFDAMWDRGDPAGIMPLIALMVITVLMALIMAVMDDFTASVCEFFNINFAVFFLSVDRRLSQSISEGVVMESPSEEDVFAKVFCESPDAGTCTLQATNQPARKQLCLYDDEGNTMLIKAAALTCANDVEQASEGLVWP